MQYLSNPQPRTPWLACGLLACAALAQAAPADEALAVYAQAGVSEHGAHSQSLGVQVPWRGFERHWLGQIWHGYWDAYLARWSARVDAGGPRESTTTWGLTPTLRMSTSARSRWFLDMGVGLALSDQHYSNHGRRLSTRYNFASSLGLGLWLDSARRHSLALRVQHVSNARIKRPNPGENFLQVRYALQF